MHFDLSRYGFRFPRYRRVKERVIISRSLSLSFSLVTLTDLSPRFEQAIDAIPRKTWHSFPRKNMGQRVAGLFIIVLSNVDTLNVHILATNRDIGMKQEATSTVWFPLHSEWILILKFFLAFLINEEVKVSFVALHFFFFKHMFYP